ncbi:MAG: creatininase family protein [Fimbriimonadaceae bacterium]|nr:creatininase family protein [Fimbriimonadaceae bacterium]
MALRYAESHPDELLAHLARTPILVAALGALEWHGPHLPLGLDGLVAEAFAERLATRLGAVLMPSVWLPITTLPHPTSLEVRTETAVAVWRDLVDQARKLDVRVLCLVSGHYAQGHMIELQRVAVAAMIEAPNTAVLAATPLERLGDDSLLDHAGRWEAAQLLSIRPELVRLEQVGDALDPLDCAVLGEDPRAATLADGEAVLERGLLSWQDEIARLMESGDLRPLVAWYGRRIRGYDAYVERYYRGSWEDAILRWWTERTSQG